ncbi:META domain-containing protein [Falsiroseomonas oryzae]|uniref:META domain-containing protein n=1 Tax=Falsiroseomonas oryzae TaxID=2766473 RepID=UPI0022EA14F4|nr:META domain-containing protein [Roseomonas sp. MO-31]
MQQTRRAILAASATLLAARDAAAQSPAIHGRATLRERGALPPGAVLFVELLEATGTQLVRLADATVPVVRQPPVWFTLPYPPASIAAGRQHLVRGWILVDGVAAWASAAPQPVLTQGAGQEVDLVLERAVPGTGPAMLAPTAPSAALVGQVWLAQEIGGLGVLPNYASTLRFRPDGLAQGTTGCNRFAVGYTVDAAGMRFGPLSSTHLRCAPDLEDQDRRLHQALGQVLDWRMDAGGLQLLDAGDVPVLRLVPQAG